MTNINFKVPDDLHREFKVLAAKTGKDMKVLLVEYIKKGVENDGKDAV